MKINIKYFALMREITEKGEETIEFNQSSASDLLAHLKTIYSIPLDESNLKVAINEEYSDWNHPIKDGDTIVFIPPVAGG